MKRIIAIMIPIIFLLFSSGLSAQPDSPVQDVIPKDLSVTPVLYTVGYAHLDTQWRWDYAETINDFLKATLDENFLRFEKYKPYVLTFSGARRYKMMKEYYPEKYEKLKKYIKQGRWFVGGSSVDECDANIPSPESVIRQVLYGNAYFRSEFNKESVDFLLPDCFGFQANLPSVLAHAGLKGFSTQKLEWGSATGIPFNIGNWTGPDGKGVIAALNATDYTGAIEPRLDTARYWVDRVMENGKKYGVFADYRYYGVGDIGGAPRENDIKNALGSLEKSDSKINVYLCSSDQLFRDLTESQKEKLPFYSGDLLLTQHSAGSLSSEAYMKRWNRKNEQLALAAEPLSVMAQWMGLPDYSMNRLGQAWWLVLGSQMHDILPGTSIPKAYEYAWNDEILAMNQFASVLENAAGILARAMDTQTEGKCIMVYNPLAISRKDLVEVEIQYPEGAPQLVKITDPDHRDIPVQVLSRTKTSIKLIFPADMPSLGLACYGVEPIQKAIDYQTSLSSGIRFLENGFYKVSLDENGDISSILDKKAGKEILSGPARLEFLKEHPAYWPAWNMDWNDRQKPPVDFVKAPARITLEEKGPLRICFKVERKARNSIFIQYISLAEDKENVMIRNIVDWQSRGVSLKASFPLTLSNNVATYNLGLGTIERSNNDEKKYEVPSREWFDLTNKSGSYGVTILEDCKFGSDKPDDKTLRLTLLYTPSANFYHDQATQDWGRHEFIYGIYAHKGDWRTGQSEWQGRRLNQALRGFQVSSHAGPLGKKFSFAGVSTPEVDIRTLKKAENSDRVILRLQELWGKEVRNVEISFASKILDAYEVDGQERRIADAEVKGGKLTLNMGKFAVRSFSVKPDAPVAKLAAPISIPLPLSYDQDVVSTERNKKNGGFEPGGFSLPAEQFPETLMVDGLLFKLGKTADGQNNALICNGQKIQLPRTGNFNRIYILASALTDTTGTFKVGGLKTNLRIQEYKGKIGQYDNRVWDKLGRIKDLEKGFIKRDEVAWYSTHLHQDTSNIPYQYAYLFKYSLDVSPSSGFIQLPENGSIRIFAISLADNNTDQARSAAALYDDFTGRSAMELDLPLSYVTETMESAANFEFTRKRNLSDLPARVSMKDYADMHMPNGVSSRYYFNNSDSSFSSLTNGMYISSLNDGMFDLLPDDSLNDLWSEKGEGRILMDLQKEIEIDSIHLFSTLDIKRGACSFSLWGAPGTKSPEVTGDPKSAGWTYLLTIPLPDIWGNGKAYYTIKPLKDQNKALRYLLWVSEDSPHGPHYFREADIFEKQK